MGEVTRVALVTLMLTITHGQLGQFTDGQVIGDEDTTTGTAYLVNGRAKSISIPFSMVPESTFNQNILVRPKLLFARTRINRKDSLGDILGELESSKHEIFAPPILEEEENSEIASSTSPSLLSSSSSSSSFLSSSSSSTESNSPGSSSSSIDDPFMTKRVDRSNRFRSNRMHHQHPHQQRQRFRFGNKSRRRQSQDDEEDEEMAQPTEIDEVDEVKEVRRPIRIRQRNLHHRHHRHHEHNKYKSSPSTRSGHRRSRGHKKVKSKVDEDDDEESSEASASASSSSADPNDSREEEKDEETITTATTTATTATNPSKLQSDRFTSDGPHNSGLIPNLLPKSYETYSPDSSSAISSFVSRIREDMKKSKEGTNSPSHKVKLNQHQQQQSQLPWIPEMDVTTSTDDLAGGGDDDLIKSVHGKSSDEQLVRREENGERIESNSNNNNNNNALNHQQHGHQSQRKSSYRINSRPNLKSSDASASMVNSPGGRSGPDQQVMSSIKEQHLVDGGESSKNQSPNDSTSTSASSFNAIHLNFNNHLPPLMNDKITERLYSRGLLVYLKDFKYGGL